MNVCGACGLDFSTVPSFDDHRVGVHDYTLAQGARREPPVYDGRRCLAVAELESSGWTRDRYGRWFSPIDHPAVERVIL
jgi:hypothetical protein